MNYIIMVIFIIDFLECRLIFDIILLCIYWNYDSIVCFFYDCIIDGFIGIVVKCSFIKVNKI